MKKEKEELKLDKLENKILDCVHQYYLLSKKDSDFKNKKIHYAGRCYDEKEITAAVKNLLKFTLTYGKDCIDLAKKVLDWHSEYDLKNGLQKSLTWFAGNLHFYNKDFKKFRKRQVLASKSCYK